MNRKTLYLSLSAMTMVINVAYNRRFGLGGGTRRLHHKNYGGELASTGVEKSRFYPV